MIYIASPYSSRDPEVMRERFEKVSKYAAHLMVEGWYVYCPIAHTHPMALYGGLNGDWSFWKPYDTYMMKLCEAVHVYQLPGWKTSKGVAAEIKIAKRLRLPVIYVKEQDAGV